MTTVAELFNQAITQAMTLDPPLIEATIRNTAGGWPGGGSSEPVSGGGTSDPTASAVIRRLTSKNPDHDLRDVGALERASQGFVASVTAVSKACSSAAPPDDWEDAIKLGHLLIEMDLVTTALDVGVKISQDIYHCHEHVLTVQRIHDGHCPHKADTFTRTIQTSTGCRSCARFGSDAPRISRMLCQPCWRQLHDIAALGDPVELQLDPAHWPSEGMWRAKADGRQVRFKQEWQSWIVSHGLSPDAVLSERRDRRRGA